MTEEVFPIYRIIMSVVPYQYSSQWPAIEWLFDRHEKIVTACTDGYMSEELCAIMREDVTEKKVLEYKSKISEIVSGRVVLTGITLDIEKISRMARSVFNLYKDLYHAPEDARNPKSTHSKPGYVYLLKSPTGYYKIGKSKIPQVRIKTLGVQLPFEIEPIAIIHSDNMNGLERELHSLFSNKRANGEWFALTEEDVEYIKALSNE